MNRQLIELMMLDGASDSEISRALEARGYIVTVERVAEMREEMDPSARGLIYEEQ